ncbi:arginine repressor [Pediococcus argentinicus]|uniref:Arginine repressor n=1 Tax=Pediococcus argentinicus TaxID=480391 RepID=A0A0R2NIS1_9LACO|nr:ArgR family transcriptional regulator [Pediococcus argentinicus]KRO25669.1 arginine repressor [Pediococcus argentinicus]NKZ21994.1 ArgR family transcriptional regulator [Pediococcus argentinicus]GEP19163.1 arginine regulator [Pediococcus argentinicus]
MSKRERQEQIINIIQSSDISTQSDLMKMLQKEGIKTTQATLSRDIRELNLVKQADITGATVYRVISEREQHVIEVDPVQEAVAESVLTITQVQFINILKTEPNEGNRVAAVIDDSDLSEIKGTIAGYDTVVIFSESPATAGSLNQKLNNYIHQR